LLSNTKNKNEIQIFDLIENVDYKIIIQKERKNSYNEIIEKEVLGNVPQSNGTGIMIMVVFIATLLKSVYKEGFNLQMPIIMDEIQNVDINNLNNLLKLIENLGLIIVGATPEASSDIRLIFSKVVTVNEREAKKLIDKKRKYIVLNKENPLFETIKI